MTRTSPLGVRALTRALITLGHIHDIVRVKGDVIRRHNRPPNRRNRFTRATAGIDPRSPGCQTPGPRRVFPSEPMRIPFAPNNPLGDDSRANCQPAAAWGCVFFSVPIHIILLQLWTISLLSSKYRFSPLPPN